METWKILLITIASAIVLGIAVGVFVGKHQLKKASGNYKPLLTIRERILYFACFALGAGCILFGAFYTFPSSPRDQDLISPDGIVIDGMEEGGVADVMNPRIDGALPAEAEGAIGEADTGDAAAAEPPADDSAGNDDLEEPDGDMSADQEIGE